jgi:hypothetical protein
MALLNTWASQQDQATLSPLDRLLNNYIQQGNAPLSYLLRGDPQGLWKNLNTPKPVNTTQDMTDLALGLVGSVKPVGDVSKGILSQYVPGVRAGEELIVQHNLSPQKLIAAQELGAMPVPSLAISKVSNPLAGYGDISLIGSKEMAMPSSANPVFRSDAYTKKKPNINYDIGFKSQENLKKEFGSLLDEVPRGDYRFSQLIDDFGDKQNNTLLEAKFLKEKGILPNASAYDNEYKFASDINVLKNANRAEYDNWLSNFEAKLPEIGVNVEPKLFKGYTPSGNRRYAPATLENIVKEMKGGASTEGFNYGVGNVRALVTPKFKNLTEIKGSRDRIIGAEDFKAVKEKFNNAYFDLTGRLKKVNPDFDANSTILDIAETRNYQLFDEMYKDAPKNLKADIGAYLDSLKSMPTEYFEIKPQRAVGIGEFKGAIVPKDLSPKAKGILENAGIKDIYEYATPEEKASLFNKFGNQMFGVGVGVPLGTGLLQDNRQ